MPSSDQDSVEKQPMNDEEKELSFENLSDIDLNSSQSKQQGPKAEEPDIGKHNPQAPEKKKR